MGEVQVLNNYTSNIDLIELASKVPELKGAEKKLLELTAFIRPKVFWRELIIDDIANSRISFDNGALVIESVYVSLGLKKCHKTTLFAITLGQELPQYAEACQAEGRLWEGTIADIFGSHAVEMLADRFHNHLKGRNLPKGLFSTLRFSPGYGDWELKEQQKIIPYLEAGQVIKVTENYLLQPVKSITALLGWADFPQEANYPQGERGRGFCGGSGGNCAYCTTWACRK